MPHDTSALLPVPFRGATITLADFNGEPFVAMRSVVEAMGMAWQGQIDKIKTRYGSVVREIMTTGSDGKRYAMTCLPLRKLAGWLMTIHPNKVKPELRERILAYQAECDDALWTYWTQRQTPSLTHVTGADLSTRLIVVIRNGQVVQTAPIPDDAFVLSAAEWVGALATPDFPKRLLPAVLRAVSARLQETQA